MGTSPLLLLDTNILVHYVRHSVVWQRVSAAHAPLAIAPTPLVCLVSHGELRSLALQWKWADKKLTQVEFCLGYFQPVSIDDPAIIRNYAAIDAFCESVGQPMGKNDLWIAATASATGATLITTDRDFDRLAPQFLNRIWVDPDSSP
jgi:tRNA(fMet)-specific endonuclease VapC